MKSPIILIPIGVQKPGPQYSPAIVVYTLHSIVMVLYLFTMYTPLATVINFLSPFSQFDAFI